MAECDSPELTHKQRMWTALRRADFKRSYSFSEASCFISSNVRS